MPVSWDIELPERGKAALGGRRPRGKLVITVDGEEERIEVPTPALKSLKNRLDGLLQSPRSRAELLYHLGMVSEECAMVRVTRLIDRRDYSTKEISDKLREDGYAASTIRRALERATSSGMVDDMRFADAFARSKVFAGWGSARIERELARRGVDVATLPGWPRDYLTPEDEHERAYELVAARRIPAKNAYPKLVRFLVSRGFSVSDATRAARRRLDEEADDTGW